jgi:hypothetical protein
MQARLPPNCGMSIGSWRGGFKSGLSIPRSESRCSVHKEVTVQPDTSFEDFSQHPSKPTLLSYIVLMSR